jgi:hypothetical protein
MRDRVLTGMLGGVNTHGCIRADGARREPGPMNDHLVWSALMAGAAGPGRRRGGSNECVRSDGTSADGSRAASFMDQAFRGYGLPAATAYEEEEDGYSTLRACDTCLFTISVLC